MKLGEFELIERFSTLLPPQPEEVAVGIGDDTAVVKTKEGFWLLTTDALVEGNHFRLYWKEKVKELFFLLGKKLVNVCASDVASMGGTPKIGLINLGIPRQTEEEEVLELYRGIGKGAREQGIAVVGGDTVKSSLLFFDMTLVGTSQGYMLRGNAKPGDLVGVTGTLGDSRGGLELLERGEVESEYLIRRFLSPKARVKEGRKALKLGVKCATDVSDGLLFNLKTVAESSKVRIEVESSKIPLSEELLKVFGRKRALHFALYGGEDYELIATFPQRLAGKLEEIGFKVIGRVVEGEGVSLDGKPAKVKGYDHFKEEE